MLKTFNTHTLFKELVAIGMDEKHVEAIIDKFITKTEFEEAQETLVTKADLKLSIADLKVDISKIESSILKYLITFFVSLIAIHISSAWLIIHFLGK